MANGILKSVIYELADLWHRGKFVIDVGTTSLRSPLGLSDNIEVPDLDSLTTVSNAASTATPDSPSINVLTLNANLHPGIFVNVTKLDQTQKLNGAYVRELAKQVMLQLKAQIDDDLVEYLGQTLTYNAGVATYVDNAAGATLTNGMIANSLAALATNNGADENSMVGVFHPHGIAAIRGIAGYVPNFTQSEAGHLGIRMVATVDGMPIFQSRSIARSRSFVVSASNIATNVVTLTVAAGHGYSIGELVNTVGLTVDADTAVAITATTATTIVIPLTGSDGANGSGTVVGTTCENLVMEKSQMFTAIQDDPSVLMAQEPRSSTQVLQANEIWGRVGRVGRVRKLHTPATVV